MKRYNLEGSVQCLQFLHTHNGDHLWCFFRIDFDVEKNNLVVHVGVYGVFGLVSNRNNTIEVAFYVFIMFVFECGDRRRCFCFFR